jgi:hypothetical protein
LFKIRRMAGPGNFRELVFSGPAGWGDEMNQKSDKSVQNFRLTQCVKGAG